MQSKKKRHRSATIAFTTSQEMTEMRRVGAKANNLKGEVVVITATASGESSRNDSDPIEEDEEEDLRSRLRRKSAPPATSIAASSSAKASFAKPKTEKSTRILLGIILVFLSCHALRFSIQLYRVFSVSSAGYLSHFEFCSARNRLHVPALFIVLGQVNHLLLVVNSSVNALIYYCGGKMFRTTFKEIFCQLNSRSNPYE